MNKNVKVFVIGFYILVVLICMVFFNPQMAEAKVLLPDFPETNWIKLGQNTGFFHEPVTDYLIFCVTNTYGTELLLLPDPDNPEKILTMTKYLELLNQK